MIGIKMDCPKTPNTRTPINASAGTRTKGIENVDAQHSKYPRLRNVLTDLRPSIIEILKAPNYRNCKATLEIHKGMMQMIDLCKQLRVETISLGKHKRSSEATPAAGSGNKRHKDNKPCKTYMVGGSPHGWNFIVFLKTEMKSQEV